jgi:hypothetical protein
MPVGLALPLGSADHCVVRSRVWDREHNAICAKSFLRPGTLRQGMGVREQSREERDAEESFPESEPTEHTETHISIH